MCRYSGRVLLSSFRTERLASMMRRRSAVYAAALLAIVLGSWAGLSAPAARDPDRGLTFSHDLHVDRHELDCIDCHRFFPGGEPLPDHALCGVCHEIDEQAPEPEQCGRCHTRADYSVDPLEPSLTAEQRFVHEPHLAQGVDCTVCHPNPQKRRLVRGPLMAFCLDCHEARGESLTECSVCHNEITQESRPRFRGAGRILHDNPQAWQRLHGREYQVDPQFCALCHEDYEASCDACHRQNRPDSHTVSWRRTTHALHASWDRARCAVCHEEDSCLKCHQNTKPRSHRRGGWGNPADLHCTTCHFPESSGNCTVCHETIEHLDARPSPHSRGSFPVNCGLCHPGGNPFRAPHPLNATIRCAECHGL